jgi:hypothetical protein
MLVKAVQVYSARFRRDCLHLNYQFGIGKGANDDPCRRRQVVGVQIFLAMSPREFSAVGGGRINR